MKHGQLSKGFVLLLSAALLLGACGENSAQIPVTLAPENLAEPISEVTRETQAPAPGETEEKEEAEVSAEPDAEPEPAPEPAPTQIRVIMVGDILLHTPVEESARKEDGGYDFSAIFAHQAEDIAGADLALVNQEVIIGGEELGISGYPAFNAPVEIADALVDAGFDVICQATNHALDKGKRGLLNDLAYWDANYPEIAVVGIADSQERAEEIRYCEQDGLKIAILNYTYGTNGIALPEGMPYAVSLLEEERVIRQLREAESNADFTIVVPHWGTEYDLGTSSMERKWAQIFLKNGADLVLGAHPHVIEPIELLTDEETGNEMLVYYSLGNFVNWTSGTGEGVANRMVGGMAQVTIGWENEETKDHAVILEYGIKPIICHVTKGFGGVTVYDLADYSDEMSEENEIRSQDSAFSADYCRDLCDRVWGELWHARTVF